METPTLDQVRSGSPLLTDAYPSPAGDDALTALIAVATGLVCSQTCRIVGEFGDDCEGAGCGIPLPGWMEPMMLQAIIMRAEAVHTLTGSGTAAGAAKAAGGGNIASFTAGPYSESYFSPEVWAKAKMLDRNPVLHEILWSLATDECRDYWLGLWTGDEAPAAEAIAYDYGSRPGGYFGR